MSNDNVEKPCWVCGKTTTSVCGACASADKPMEISFCSRECQKLVWPMHKHFCGPGKTNPFTLPPLSKEEADEALKHAHTMYQFGKSKDSLRWRISWVFQARVLASRCRSFSSICKSRPVSPKTPMMQAMLGDIRFSEWQRLRSANPKLGRLESVSATLQQIGMSLPSDGDEVTLTRPDFPCPGLFTAALHRLSFVHYLIAESWHRDKGDAQYLDAFRYNTIALEEQAKEVKQFLPDQGDKLESSARLAKKR
ncbi:hypothetical protein JCM8547_001369 [Rhodosporidiobolus lusitaniae]